MQVGQRRIPFRILKRIELFYFILFPVVAALAIYLGIIRQHKMFYVAAVIALLYEFAMYMATSRDFFFQYALVLHGLVALIIGAVFIIAFEYYAFGVFALSALGIVFAAYLIRIAIGDATFREVPRNTNGSMA